MVGGHAARQTGGAGDAFRVLFVCTGNICRSPTAEILFRHLLKGRLGGREAARFTVSSAGVHAVVGSAMHPMARAQLAPWGLGGDHADAFVARQLRPALASGVDLVLGASPHHRSDVLGEHPELLDRTFSIREFARLTTGVDTEGLPTDLVARARTVVVGARAQRGRVPAPDDDRVPDPMGGPPEAHQRSTMLIFTALRTILDGLVGVSGTRKTGAAPSTTPSGTAPGPTGAPSLASLSAARTRQTGAAAPPVAGIDHAR